MPKNTTKIPRKSQRVRQAPVYRVRFGLVSPEEAAQGHIKATERKKTGLVARQHASEVQLKALILTAGQRAEIDALYAVGETVSHTFYVYGDRMKESQTLASALMAQHGLDIDAREEPSSRWNTRWIDVSTRNSGPGQTRKVLYQCDCGYDHGVRGTKKRHTPAEFTGCLAHVEITYVVATQQILRLRGFLNHNQSCRDALLTMIPPQPLHESVFRVALTQLSAGISLQDIKKKNRSLVMTRAYPEMPQDPRDWKRHRWIILPGDSRSLYRQFSRMNGIKVTEQPHINLHEWLDPQSPQYNKTLADGVFHYSARAARGDRLEVCVATKEMKELAWRYSHRSQLLMDGTFGICDKRVLLFILMGIDEDGHGVPLAFLFFSAPTGSKHTAAGYDTKILTKLLREWRKSLEEFNGGEKFYPLTVVTDTDLKERGALAMVFPDVVLLICRVHLRRSWKNHRNKVLKGKSPIHVEIRRRLRALEDALVKTTSFESAGTLIEDEVEVQTEGAMAEPVYAGGLAHLSYLSRYWMSRDLWASWSDYGRHGASRVLGCTFAGVIPTTNHLESFNAVLKTKYLRREKKGGRRLRLDVLLKFIVTDMLPSIFEQRNLERDERERRKTWILALPGGEQLWQQRQAGRPSLAPVAYLAPDENRELGARQILTHNQLSAPTAGDNEFTFTCYSSLATNLDLNPLVYRIRIPYNGLASCSCHDFLRRGGACKHIRASLAYLDKLRADGLNIPNITLPISEEAGRAILTHVTLTNVEQETRQRSVRLILSATTRSVQRLEDLLAGDAFTEPEMNDDDGNLSRHEAGDDAMADEDADGNSSEEEDIDDDEDAASSDAGGLDETDEFKFTILRGSGRAGVHQQAVSRTIFELSAAVPRLEELAHYLEDNNVSMEPTHLTTAVMLRSKIQLLTDQLDRMILEASTTKTDHTAPTPTHPHPSPSSNSCTFQPTLSILPPSPERPQKRKDSYSVH